MLMLLHLAVRHLWFSQPATPVEDDTPRDIALPSQLQICPPPIQTLVPFSRKDSSHTFYAGNVRANGNSVKKKRTGVDNLAMRNMIGASKTPTYEQKQSHIANRPPVYHMV